MTTTVQLSITKIPWSNSIVESWTRSKLKYLALYLNGYAFKPADWGSTGKPILRIAQLSSDAEPNYFDGEIDKKYLIKEGDLLFSWSATLDSFIWLGDEAWLNQHIFKVVPKSGVDKKYLYYLIKFIAPILGDSDAHGSAMKHIKKESLSQTLYKPDYETQLRIGKYLDAETRRIQILINKQNEILRLLDEKENSLIFKVITQGLRKDVSENNVNGLWFTQVPSHWDVKKIKYLFRINKRIVGHEGPDVLSITQQGIIVKDVKSGDGQLAQDYSKYQIVNKNDFAMNHMDLLTGYVDISKYDGVTSPDYRVFTILNNKYCKKYFLYIFQQCYKQKIFFPLGQGSSQLGRWRLPAKNFKEFLVPVPPMREQEEIVEYIEKESKVFAVLRKDIKKQVALLKERETSIIAQVITGQVQV